PAQLVQCRAERRMLGAILALAHGQRLGKEALGFRAVAPGRTHTRCVDQLSVGPCLVRHARRTNGGTQTIRDAYVIFGRAYVRRPIEGEGAYREIGVTTLPPGDAMRRKIAVLIGMLVLPQLASAQT